MALGVAWVYVNTVVAVVLSSAHSTTAQMYQHFKEQSRRKQTSEQ